MDDDADCAGHVWRLESVQLEDEGAWRRWVCAVCGAVSLERPEV